MRIALENLKSKLIELVILSSIQQNAEKPNLNYVR